MSARAAEQQEALHRFLMEAVRALRPEIKIKCADLNCPRETRLRQAIRHAIEVLESTRSSFKSSQLAQLRKELICVLAEEEPPRSLRKAR